MHLTKRSIRRHTRAEAVQAYSSETVEVRADNKCLSCHPSPHSVVSASAEIGVGVNLPGLNGKITVDSNGKLNLGVSAGNLLVGGMNVAVNPFPGPNIRVIQPGPLNIKSLSPGRATAVPDNTRVGY